jgi:hypothetical protein
MSAPLSKETIEKAQLLRRAAAYIEGAGRGEAVLSDALGKSAMSLMPELESALSTTPLAGLTRTGVVELLERVARETKLPQTPSRCPECEHPPHDRECIEGAHVPCGCMHLSTDKVRL